MRGDGIALENQKRLSLWWIHQFRSGDEKDLVEDIGKDQPEQYKKNQERVFS